MSSWKSLVPATLEAIQKNGLKKTIYQILTAEQPRVGTLVGKDQFGNEYYENKADQAGRSRWVMYHKYNWDASQIPPEWHQWMHRFTDEAPSVTPLPKASFTPEHTENLTGTTMAYRPYNTTTPKVEAWQGGKPSRSR